MIQLVNQIYDSLMIAKKPCIAMCIERPWLIWVAFSCYIYDILLVIQVSYLQAKGINYLGWGRKS